MRRAFPEETSVSSRLAAEEAKTPRRGARGAARGAGGPRLEKKELREVPFVTPLEHGERAFHVCTAPSPQARAPGVQHAPAADRLGGRKPAEGEAVRRGR